MLAGRREDGRHAIRMRLDRLADELRRTGSETAKAEAGTFLRGTMTAGAAAGAIGEEDLRELREYLRDHAPVTTTRRPAPSGRTAARARPLRRSLGAVVALSVVAAIGVAALVVHIAGRGDASADSLPSATAPPVTPGGSTTTATVQGASADLQPVATFRLRTEGGDQATTIVRAGKPVPLSKLPEVAPALHDCGGVDLSTGHPATRAIAVPITLRTHLESSLEVPLQYNFATDGSGVQLATETVVDFDDGIRCPQEIVSSTLSPSAPSNLVTAWVVYLNVRTPDTPDGDPSALGANLFEPNVTFGPQGGIRYAYGSAVCDQAELLLAGRYTADSTRTVPHSTGRYRSSANCSTPSRRATPRSPST